MWRVDRTFLFLVWSEPGTGARPSLQKLWRVDRRCGGLNLEQVLCGGSTALFFFLRSELRTGARPSLQKLWRVDRTFLFFWVV